MNSRPGRNEKWERAAENRQPVENTPRREKQLRDLEQERQQGRRTA